MTGNGITFLSKIKAASHCYKITYIGKNNLVEICRIFSFIRVYTLLQQFNKNILLYIPSFHPNDIYVHSKFVSKLISVSKSDHHKLSEIYHICSISFYKINVNSYFQFVNILRKDRIINALTKVFLK